MRYTKEQKTMGNGRVVWFICDKKSFNYIWVNTPTKANWIHYTLNEYERETASLRAELESAQAENARLTAALDNAHTHCINANDALLDFENEKQLSYAIAIIESALNSASENESE